MLYRVYRAGFMGFIGFVGLDFLGLSDLWVYRGTGFGSRGFRVMVRLEILHDAKYLIHGHVWY